MKNITATFGNELPLLANMVEGGKTPISSVKELEDIGYHIAIFPGGAVRAIAHHLNAYYSGLLRDGNNKKFSEKMYDFDGLNEVIGTKELLAQGIKYE